MGWVWFVIVDESAELYSSIGDEMGVRFEESAEYVGGLTIGQGRYAGEPFRLLGWQRRFLSETRVSAERERRRYCVGGVLGLYLPPDVVNTP